MSPALAAAVPAAAAPAVAARRRPVALLVALAIALTACVLPQRAQAHTATATHMTARTTEAYARSMLGLLNQERQAHGQLPLTMSWRLRLSAHRHNLRMAADDTMSHQLPGEAFFATRISRTGYHWRAAGENIGWTSRIADSALLGLERQMYREVAPHNGHRLNILSHSFRQVGIDVYYDAKHHTMWFTQDFGVLL